MTKKVVFLGTGGTIAGKALSATDNVGYRAGEVSLADLLDGNPSLTSVLLGFEVEAEQVAQIDSKDMGWSEWQALAARVRHHLSDTSVRAVVITHGTDTLEETAYFLSRVLPSDLLLQKAVVLVCAMRPSTAVFPDGPQNLRDAVLVAVDSVAHGVLVVCAGRVHAARFVQKVHPYRLDAFSSGEKGPLAYVEEGSVRWGGDVPEGSVAPMDSRCLGVKPIQWPRVEILVNTVGIGGAAVRSICATPQGGDPAVRGIVVAGTGNGTVNNAMEDALRVAMSQGVRVVRATRCPLGQIVYANNVQHEAPEYDGLSPVKTRIALVLELLGH